MQMHFCREETRLPAVSRTGFDHFCSCRILTRYRFLHAVFVSHHVIARAASECAKTRGARHSSDGRDHIRGCISAFHNNCGVLGVACK